MSRLSKRYVNKRTEGTFKIQITSMVDMFVIILVFLLKSFTTSPVQITPSDQLALPASTSTKDPVDGLKMVVTQQGIFVDDLKVAEVREGGLATGQTDAADPNFIRPLFNELDKHAEKSRNIAKVNEEVKFDGKIIVQADKQLTYDLLRKVMYTSMMAGYADVKFAVISK